ncbi:MAG: succinate dehydrogenase, cytochrome b556 subunit [Pseudomonadota bacterium]
MAKPSADPRPISPHLQVWKFHPTMVSSILHRASGVVNAIGLVLVSIWLIVLASGADAYAGMQAFLSGPIGVLVKLALAGFTLSLVYHFLNGIRHLAWDLGLGFDAKGSNQRSMIIFIASITLTAVIWLFCLEIV